MKLNGKCLVHERAEHTYFCTTCEYPVCDSCLEQVHVGHKRARLVDECDARTKSLRAAASQLSVSQGALEEVAERNLKLAKKDTFGDLDLSKCEEPGYLRRLFCNFEQGCQKRIKSWKHQQLKSSNEKIGLFKTHIEKVLELKKTNSLHFCNESSKLLRTLS